MIQVYTIKELHELSYKAYNEALSNYKDYHKLKAADAALVKYMMQDQQHFTLYGDIVNIIHSK